MARIDKVAVSFRALAGTALTGVRAVVLNSGGSVVPSGSADPVGVICVPGTIVAGEAVSVLQHGELVEFAGSASTKYYAIAGGTIAATAGGTQVGFSVEADRLVVKM